MRFGSIKAKGLGPFRDEIAIDFDAIDGMLVAITGENGAGKSTILELLGGSMYRTCPTRGSLASLATARDSFLEVGVVNGASHRIRHVVDSVSGKGESLVTDALGRPLVASGKMREFDAWAAKHLPTPEVLYSSTFAAQGSGGFLDLKPAERKGVLLRVLGIERLEALAEKAREHVRATKMDGALLDARVADEKARSSDPETVAAELEAFTNSHAQDLSALEEARKGLDALLATEAQAKEVARVREDLAARRSLIEGRLNGAHQKLSDLRKRIDNNAGLVAQAEEIRAARAKARELDAKLADVSGEIGDARHAEGGANRDRVSARDALADVSARLQRAIERVTRIGTRLTERATIDLAVASLPDLKAAVAGDEVLVETIEESLRKTTDLRLSDTAERVENLRNAVRKIAEGVAAPVDVAAGALRADDQAATDAKEVPERLEKDRRNLEVVRTRLASKRRDLAAAEKTASRAAELDAAAAELVEAKAEVVRLTTDETAARERYVTTDEAAGVTTKKLGALLSSKTALATERTALDPLLKLADRLAQAEARISELAPQAQTTEEEIAAAEKELAELPAPPEAIPSPNVGAARVLVDSLEKVVRGAEGAIAVKRAQLSDAQASAKRLEGLARERAKVDEDLADWSRLAEDLGRDGIQALEIDAAGPELTELVNDLLRTCVGSRWTVSIEASKLSSDGKKTLEGCEVRVLDTERGREGSAESLSGGERVLVGEAVSLALSMLACRRSGVQGPTLVRDESGAALDPVNGRNYIAMLRRAAALVGASKVLFVAHNAELQELADARINICGGKVSVA